VQLPCSKLDNAVAFSGLLLMQSEPVDIRPRKISAIRCMRSDARAHIINFYLLLIVQKTHSRRLGYSRVSTGCGECSVGLLCGTCLRDGMARCEHQVLGHIGKRQPRPFVKAFQLIGCQWSELHTCRRMLNASGLFRRYRDERKSGSLPRPGLRRMQLPLRTRQRWPRWAAVLAAPQLRQSTSSDCCSKVSGWSSPVDRRQVRALGAEEISEVSAYF